MSRRRTVALAGGLLAAGVGLLLAAAPWLAVTPNLGDWAVPLLGTIALVYAVGPLYRRHGRERQVAAGPDPETPASSPTPGADVDEMLSTVAGANPRTDDRRRLRQRLHEATVDAVERRESCDPETARDLIEAGTWTDDSVAASYFTDGPVVAPEEEVPPAKRLRLRLSGPARRAFAARRVANEIAAMMDSGDRR